MQSVLTDSLEKVLGDAAPRPADLIGGAHASGFLGEMLSVQVALLLDEADGSTVDVQLSGSAAGLVQLSAVRRVPVSTPAPEEPDEHYLVTEPGDYPDLLEPLTGGTVQLTPGRWEALWVDVVAEAEADAGEHELTITLRSPDGEHLLAEHTAHLQIHPHRLPPLSVTNTHWFHADSLSTYYGVEVFSERHWELIEAFLASAREMDVNSVLTPTWTPPLDTAEGHTRPVVQLVGIEDTGGEHRFDFSRLDRWLEICRRLGFTGIEIAHLFTQWGARSTPAIQVRTADGLEDRFGWHVEATSPDYRRLLEALIPALRSHLDAAWDGDVLWHVSDEPSQEHLEAYTAAKAQVSDLLEGAHVVDALSSFTYAEQGVVATPIVATDHVGPFLEAGRTPWVYYCVSQNRDVANRFIALPSVRNRVLGRQLFAFDAPGFLHWGYNFWWTQFSLAPVDPFTDTCAGGPFFGGDAFAVYPGPDGTPWLSIRHRVFAQAMADHRALTLLAELTDRPSAKALIDEGGTLTYSSFSYDTGAHLRARRAVDERILGVLSSARR
ncbi:MAG: glycoside hydrolase domain-containing protein [Brachybacterium tyrofermentans]